ncbi:hypothetical protein ACVWWG_000668 [Bradyrhizobium sp. LB7.2]
MGARDLLGNVQSEPKPFLVRQNVATIERSEKARHRLRRNWRTFVDNADVEASSGRLRQHPDRLVGRSIGNRVAEKIGQHLTYAAGVDPHSPWNVDDRFDNAIRMHVLELCDNLLDDRLECLFSQLELHPGTEPRAGEVHDIVDQTRHPGDASLQKADPVLPLFIDLLVQKPQAALDRGKRVSEVVTEHGDKLLAQFGILSFQRQPVLDQFDAVARVEVRRDSARQKA